MTHPWLSVIMPTYNGSRYVGEALQSVVDQSDPDVEVIVVDDGSDDDTLAIVDGFRDQLCLRILEHGQDGNWAVATNLGMQSARAPFCCWLHQDDVWTRHRLKQLKRWVAERPDALIFLHPSEFIDSSGRTVGRWRCPLYDRPTGWSSEEIAERLLIQDFVAASAPVFRSELIDRVGGLDEQLWFLADWDFWLKAVGAGPIAYRNDSLLRFRLHNRSQTVERAAEIAWQYEVVLNRHLPLWRGRIPNFHQVTRTARFSARVNIALTAWMTGNRPWLTRVLTEGLTLGPSGWRRYVRDSRIMERVIGRVRAGLAGKHHWNRGSDRTNPEWQQSPVLRATDVWSEAV